MRREGDLRYSGEGVSGNTFDSSAVSFDSPNQGTTRLSQLVHITAIATDERGHSASVASDVIVTLSAQAARTDDLIFAANSSELDECQRMVLQEGAAHLQSDPGMVVYLIGHQSADEANPGLDLKRANNVAAFLNKCQRIALIRIRVAGAGSAQDTATKPSECRVRPVKGATAAKDSKRRVELYIVPSGYPASLYIAKFSAQSPPSSSLPKEGTCSGQ